MKRFILILALLLTGSMVWAVDDAALLKEKSCQQYINEIGTTILNANKIDKHIIFTYNKDEYKKTMNDPTITKRQIIFYKEYFKYIDNDDEMAAFLAHQISRAVKSFSGEWGGFVSSAQIKFAPKKYEIFADKRAVDYMVNAGYNPIGLITLLNKIYPQNVLDKLIFHNPPTRRMAIVYEYIYNNYPYYLANNPYINNINYQNFLLNSVENRAKLKEKIQTGSTKRIKYD